MVGNMNSISKKILNHLIDRYENSKSFNGENKVSQTFSIQLGSMFKKYTDDAVYDFFIEINESVKHLQQKSYITAESLKNGVIQRVTLNLDMLDDIYATLGRISKKDDIAWIYEVWDNMQEEHKINSSYKPEAYNKLLSNYIMAQKERLMKNQSVEYFLGSRDEYLDILKAVRGAVQNEHEIFIRDFSISIFNDSKRMEQLKGKAQSFLFSYGDYEEREHVLEECGIVNTPTYVSVKGKGILIIGKQKLDLSMMNGDIALSTESIKELKSIKVIGERVVTVENMTSFHDFSGKEAFVIYLGGFHNKVKQEMIKQVYLTNTDKSYYHFGDIDAGGFYIFEHLCIKTGVSFRLMNMGVDMLQKYKEYWKPLTKNDESRLRQLIDRLDNKELSGQEFEDYRDVLYFMLHNNCKLEQESISW